MTRPEVPTADATAAQYWAGAAEGLLLLKTCLRCERQHWYPRSHCPYCFSAKTEWREATVTGTVYSFTVVQQNGSKEFRDQVPYAIGFVTLSEGPRVFGLLRGELDMLHVGQEVRVDFESIGESVHPVFVTLEGPLG